MADINPNESLQNDRLLNIRNGCNREAEEEVEAAQSSRTNDMRTGDARDGEKMEHKPSKLQEMWEKVGLDIGTLMMMFKGSVAPTIAIAFYQADSVRSQMATVFETVPPGRSQCYC